jgi:hypothetical protein
MGFMDKAKAAAQDAAEKGKKAAAQAQEKLDETQKNFNSNQAHSQDNAAPAVEYDKHGRKIASGDTVEEVVDSPEPAAEVAIEDTGAPQGDPLADELPPAAAPKPPSGDGMSSGDPLAG